MLAAWVRREEIKTAREKGRAEGLMEARKENWAKGLIEGLACERKIWQEWLRELDAWEQRKSHAKNQGQDFQEPRPAPPA